jgi:hypothetical protein
MIERQGRRNQIATGRRSKCGTPPDGAFGVDGQRDGAILDKCPQLGLDLNEPMKAGMTQCQRAVREAAKPEQAANSEHGMITP